MAFYSDKGIFNNLAEEIVKVQQIHNPTKTVKSTDLLSFGFYYSY